MNTPWVRSSTALPREDQPVEFVLDNRNAAIEGTYTGRIFQSRWTSYDIERVRAWRIAAFSSNNPAQDAGCISTAKYPC
jgi:hypothetical protein